MKTMATTIITTHSQAYTLSMPLEEGVKLYKAALEKIHLSSFVSLTMCQIIFINNNCSNNNNAAAAACSELVYR